MGARRFLRRRRHDVLFGIALGARALAVVLPRWLGIPMFGMAGRVMFAFGGVDRRRTVKHLTEIYGDRWDERRILCAARNVYVHLAMNLFDAIRIPRLGNRAHDRVVQHDSVEAMQAAQKSGKGIIVIVAHTGCFEMLLPFFGRKGVPGFAIGQRLFDRRVDALVAHARTSWGMEYVYRTANPREIIRRLKQCMAFGVLIDQDTAVEGVFAHFMGKLAYTPSGPLKLAMKMGFPVFVATTARVEHNRHRVFIKGPLDLASGGVFEEDLVRNVEKANAAICSTIERYPEQWVWMHRRWRRKADKPRYAGVPNIEKLGAASESSMVHFDVEELNTRLGDDKEIVREALRIFLDSSEPRVRELDAALESGDRDLLRKLGHTVRGVSLTVSAPELARLGAELERLSPEAPIGDLRVAVDLIAAEYAAALSAVESYLRSSS